MEQLLIHLLKSSALLAIFFLAYQLLLRNDTNFQINRHFLLAGILASLLLPSIEFTRIVEVENQGLPLDLPLIEAASNISSDSEEGIDWYLAAGLIYIIGLSFFLLRILLQLFSLKKIIQNGTRTTEGQNILININKRLSPFSFFHYIVVNPAQHSEEELKIVLQHEKIHASQWHSADVLLSNFAAAILWFNPISWWYKNSLIQNLEYIADKETVAASIPKKQYQHSLVKFSVADYQPALANNFYQSLIKKRIIMLNKKPTHNLPLIKLGAVIPFIFAFMFFFNVNTLAQVNAGNDPATEIGSKSLNSLSQKIGLAPLYVIKDKQYATDELIGKSVLLKGTVSALSKEDGQKKFGNIAKDGAIIISEGEIIDDLQASFGKIDDNALPVKHIYISVREGAKPELITLNKSADWESINASVNVKAQARQQAAPLYIVNGEAVPETFNINSINPDHIATVNVYKGDNATEVYGEKGKNGVVVINLKKGEEETQGQVSDGMSGELSDNPDILYVLNGKVMDASFKSGDLDPHDIESINVLKGQSAIEKYGEKATEGVIEIITKDEK